MAICNLFKELSKPTGEFLMFSQYAEDLTKNNAQGYKYRVVPSRFIAADIDFSKLSYRPEGDLDKDFPTYMRNYFENGCAVCKNSSTWTPETSSNLFWRAMVDGKLISFDKDYVKEFKCIEEINIQSYDVMSGMGYSEIYCYIPNSTKCTKYKYKKYTTTNYTPSNSTLEGYDEKINPINYYYEKSIEFDFENGEVDNVGKFNINCIILLYDIHSSDENGNITTLYKNIPLGIYLPGCFNGTTNISNPITKWVSNSDIYNSGTSYGIRICSRFTVTPTEDVIETTVNSISSEEYASICQVMGGVVDNLSQMMEIVKAHNEDSVFIKEELALFKNSRTNVPYVKNGYWFVNGRSTGIAIPDTDNLIPYENSQIDNAIFEWMDMPTTFIAYPVKNGDVNIYNEDGKEIAPPQYYFEQKNIGDIQKENDLYLYWKLAKQYTGERLDIISISINNGKPIENPSPIIYAGKIKKAKNTIELSVQHALKEERETLKINVNYYAPIFFGLLDNESTDNDGNLLSKNVIEKIKSNKISINEVEDIISNILPTKSNTVSFKSNGGIIVYAYPKSYGLLDEIINLNSMDDCIYDFVESTDKTPYTITVPFANGNMEYYLYHSTNSTNKDIDVSFKFNAFGEQSNKFTI